MNFMWSETTKTPSEWQIKATCQEQNKPAVINENIKAGISSHTVVTLS